MHANTPRLVRSRLLPTAVCAAMVLTGVVATGAPSTAHETTSVPASSTSDAELTADQAVTRARQTGQPVDATAETTPTDQVTANPDGTLTLTRHAVPVRKKINGTWRNLDPTLHTNPNGTITPALTSADLTLSGGGAGPLATLRTGGKSLALSLPMALPAPVLSGPTATYANILPGVDLQVTVSPEGGFSHSFVVRDAKAATNPALAPLTYGINTEGVQLNADNAGNLTATDQFGHDVFAAAAPTMWDSATPPAPATPGRAAAADSTDAGAGRPTTSSTSAPGKAAHTAPLAVKVKPGKLSLTPTTSMFTAPDTVYPVYIDPTWTMPVTGGTQTGYASVADQLPTSNKWKSTADPNSDWMQVGDENGWRARTLINFKLDTGKLNPTNITIDSATLYLVNVYSYSCTPTKTRVFAPSTTLTQSNATWSYWFGSNPVALGSVINPNDLAFAHGYDSSCKAAGVSFNVKTAIQSDVSARKATQTFVLTGDSNETSDNNSWKKFSISSAALTIKYNHTPNKPSGLKTGNLGCGGTVGSVGDGDVTLYAPVSDPDGGLLGVTYTVTVTATGTQIASSDRNTLTVNSGSTAVLIVPEATLKEKAGSAVTEFSWKAQAYDGYATSDWSDTCNFNFDPTRPGPPNADRPEDPTYIGTPVDIAVRPPLGTIPTKYLWQLNAGGPNYEDAHADGTATITVTPTRLTNTLTIIAVSAGGNIGTDPKTIIFNTAPNTSQAPDADMTGDGIADLVTVGATNDLPSGVWLAAGSGNGQVATTATNLGINGNGVTGDYRPDDFTDAQAITGAFAGDGLQDLFVYYPTATAGVEKGSAVILNGNGDGSALQPNISDNTHNVDADCMLEQDETGTGIPGTWPLQVANGGDAIGSGDNYADLIAIGGTSGNYHLDYYFYASLNNLQGVLPISAPTPDGDMNWSQWRIATAQIGPTGARHPDMFLWKPTSGAVYLWRNLDMASGDLAYAPYQTTISGTAIPSAGSIQAADANADGTPDLRVVTANHTITSYLTSKITPGSNGATGTATLTAQPAQTLSTAQHAWSFNDIGTAPNGASITTTGDTTPSGTTALPLAGNGNARWHTGDAFDPDAQLNTTDAGAPDASGTGHLATSTAALNTTTDFSVTAWVELLTTGGVVLSQDANNTAGFKLWAEPSDKSWRFAIPSADTSSPTWYTAAAQAGTAIPGVWTQLIATYKRSTGELHLYVDGVDVAYTIHTATVNAAGGLRIGDARTGAGTYGNYLNGQVSLVQIYNQAITPAQPTTPPSYYEPITQTRILDTRTGTGGTTGPVTTGKVVKLQIAGANNIPAANVTAVAINLTVTGATDRGFLTVYPDNTPPPVSSSLNYLANNTVANFAIVPVGNDGYIDLLTYSSDTDSDTSQILADVTGYYTSAPTATSSGYNPLTPTRLLDTRTGTGGTTVPIPANSKISLKVAGTAGIPADATAVAITFTATGASGNGFLTTYPSGTTKPAVSGVQFTASQAIADMSIVQPGANGMIDIWATAAQTDVVADATGYFTAGTTGMKYHPILATRVFDSRTDGEPLPAWGIKQLSQGNTIIATNPTIIINITITQPTMSGYATAYADGTARPATSTIDWSANQTIAALAQPATGANGTIDIYNASGGTTQLVIDYRGYYSTD